MGQRGGRGGDASGLMKRDNLVAGNKYQVYDSSHGAERALYSCLFFGVTVTFPRATVNRYRGRGEV